MKKANLPPDPENMNEDRAKRAHDMMQEFWHVTDDVPEHPFAEILCDLCIGQTATALILTIA